MTQRFYKILQFGILCSFFFNSCSYSPDMIEPGNWVSVDEHQYFYFKNAEGLVWKMPFPILFQDSSNSLYASPIFLKKEMKGSKTQLPFFYKISDTKYWRYSISKAPATLFWDDRLYLANDLDFAQNIDSFAYLSLERIEDYNAREKTFHAVFKDYNNGKVYKVLYKKNVNEARSETAVLKSKSEAGVWQAKIGNLHYECFNSDEQTLIFEHNSIDKKWKFARCNYIKTWPSANFKYIYKLNTNDKRDTIEISLWSVKSNSEKEMTFYALNGKKEIKFTRQKLSLGKNDLDSKTKAIAESLNIDTKLFHSYMSKDSFNYKAEHEHNKFIVSPAQNFCMRLYPSDSFKITASDLYFGGTMETIFDLRD